MEFCKKLISSCLIGRGRSTIAVFLVMLIAFGLIAPPPAEGADRGHSGDDSGGGRRQP